MAAPSLPHGAALVRTTDVFDEATIPAGLLRAHRIASGTWGRLVVSDGEIGFGFEDEPTDDRVIATDHDQVIPPGRRHRVTVVGPVRFVVEFYKVPGTVTT